MKKFVALMLAMMLVIGMASVAMAAGYESATNSNLFTAELAPDSKQELTIVKGYAINNESIADDDNKHPADSIKLKLDKAEYYFNGQLSTSATPPTLTLTDTPYTIDEGKGKIEFKLNLPDFSGKPVGEYAYYLYEEGSSTAGVTYLYTTTNPLILKVTLINSQAEGAAPGDVVIGGIALRNTSGVNPGNKTYENTNKLDASTGSIDDVHNNYEKGKLTVTKTVTGNMANTNKPWIFKAEFTPATGETVRGTVLVSGSGTYCGDLTTAPTGDENTATGADAASANTIAAGWSGTQTVYFTLTNGQNMVFDNIPEGVTYKITEVEAGMYGYTTTVDASDTVKSATVEDQSAAATAAQVEGGITAAKQEDTAAFTNTKNQTPDTGIALDAVPYVMIMAITLMGAAMMIVRRRKEDM